MILSQARYTNNNCHFFGKTSLKRSKGFRLFRVLLPKILTSAETADNFFLNKILPQLLRDLGFAFAFEELQRNTIFLLLICKKGKMIKTHLRKLQNRVTVQISVIWFSDIYLICPDIWPFRELNCAKLVVAPYWLPGCLKEKKMVNSSLFFHDIVSCLLLSRFLIYIYARKKNLIDYNWLWTPFYFLMDLMKCVLKCMRFGFALVRLVVG